MTSDSSAMRITDSPPDAFGHGRKSPVGERRTPEPLLDSEQAAAIMQIHPKTLQRLARIGAIRGIHIGKLWRFRASDIERWIDSQIAS